MFPGQGSQYAGMRSKLGIGNPDLEALFAQADAVLGFPLTRLIDEGPDEELTATRNAQPALLAMGVAAGLAVRARGHCPHIVMGHSLGEYSALVAAGALPFDEALRLVRTRGELMAKAVERTPGKMAAVVGADRQKLEALVTEIAQEGILEITNVNSANQLVLSGENRTLDLLVERANAERVGRAMALNVSAPFHSSLMKPMAEEFAGHLARIPLAAPTLCFIDNVTGRPETDPEEIRRKLVLQLFSPVQWERSVLTAAELGAATFIECGPKSVLSGLVKRTVKGVSIVASEGLLATGAA
jgi:[acyl-carrier-protein] S-malonyltransferase